MVKKKIVLPRKNPDCPSYRELNEEMLFYLRAVEDLNECKLEVFWELNGCNKKDVQI
jgi:hypothetical protein